MKIIAVYVTLFMLGFLLLAFADMLYGLSFAEILMELSSPFGILTITEYIMIPLALATPLFPLIASYRRNKRGASNK